MRRFVNRTNSLTALRKTSGGYEYYSNSYKCWKRCTNDTTAHQIYIGKSDYWRRISIKTYYNTL